MADDFYEEVDQKVYMVRESSYLTPYQGTKVTALTAEYPHLIPININTDGFDFNLPRRLHEKLYGIGGGKHPTAIANTKQEPVSFTIETKMQNALFLSYAIAGSAGSVTPTGTTHQIETITCIGSASMTQSGYFILDVVDADGTQDHYSIWSNVNGGGADPEIGFGSTAVECAVGADDAASVVATALAADIDALDHVGATSDGAVVTVTHVSTAGAACCHIRDGAVASGHAFATTTNGVTTHTITEGTGRGLGSFTLHIEQNQDTDGEDIRFDLFGCVVDTYSITIDYENGLVTESVGIKCPHYAVSNNITNLPPQYDADHAPHSWVNLTEAAGKYLLQTTDSTPTVVDVTPKIVTKVTLEIANNVKLQPEIGYSYCQHVVAGKRDVKLNIVGFADDSDRLVDFVDTWTNNSSTPASSYYTTLAKRLNSVIKLQRDGTTDYFELSIYNWIIDEHSLKVFNIDEGILGIDLKLSGATPDSNKRLIPSLVVVDYMADFQYE